MPASDTAPAAGVLGCRSTTSGPASAVVEPAWASTSSRLTVPDKHVLAWRPHLAHDEHTLATKLVHVNRHLRVAEIAVGQLRLERRGHVAQGHAAGAHAPEERIVELAVVLDAKAAGERRLVEYRHREHVLGPDHVVGRLGLLRRQRRRERDRECDAYQVGHGRYSSAANARMRSNSRRADAVLMRLSRSTVKVNLMLSSTRTPIPPPQSVRVSMRPGTLTPVAV